MSNICTIDLLDELGRYLRHNELATMLGGNCNARAIAYCGGRIIASSNAFFMIHLGFIDVAVYTALLQKWAANPDNPMAAGTS